ncbi:YfiT family bacillithiol transferase [Sungkyunkwania multivorans]|uniref:YfiT family bacillithiol transferase n=1 Tax=Sungkyunkwania multivorans TaxID=1173618 RepID=A0ABW3D225_9FLAO
MTNTELDHLRYPIGKFEMPEEITDLYIKEWTNILEQFPTKLEKLVIGLSEEQLDTPYRPDGWTVRQVVHHVADSHHHSYTRIKWALTEDNPMIKAYFEARWAELTDTKLAPIRISLDHLKALHVKLVYLIKGLSEEELKRTYVHPEDDMEVDLKEHIGKYAWHSEHHFHHIKNLLERKGWL